ncbi:MAG: septal ring lytic transglycosylase RlpA family protein [Burkholderiales bacterium]
MIRIRWIALLPIFGCCLGHAPAAEQSPASDSAAPSKAHRQPHARQPHKKRVGKASIYSRKFEGKKTADGTPFKSESHSAASKTLPLGTTARVKNLKNGRTTVVKIKDRGPYVKDRIVDVAPQAARELGMEKHGVVAVEVTPIAVPGNDKRGDEAEKASSETKP